jgi:transcriptional regulator with XRE-family HTH domain
MIENDAADPRASVLRKIALALGVSADILLGIKEELEKGDPEA